jgi:serine/threonine protein kinase
MRREARAMAAVTHPSLALIFGAETWHGTPMLVLELLEGGSLAERLARSPLPIPAALELGIALAGAVAELHRAGILHRDIKPSNIGFTRDGAPKLLDFGLARVLGDEREEAAAAVAVGPDLGLSEAETMSRTMKTPAGCVVGTPLYMSPEALRGERANPSFDLWGLAVVLWEAIAGCHPFAGPDRLPTRERVSAARVPAVEALRPDCPAKVADFFKEALHRKASRRPGSAAELARRLQELRGERLSA